MNVRILAGVGVSALAVTAFAAPTLDGVRDASYGAPLAVQSVETQFGDNFSELDAGYATVSGGNLYVLLTGNLEGNFNKLNIFIDSVAGGQNVLDVASNPTNDSWSDNYNGFRFDTGFRADYMFIGRNGNFGGDRFDADFATIGGGPAAFEDAFDIFGGTKEGANANALPGAGIGVAFNNSNVAGILGGTAAADQVAAAAVTTGIELVIPLSSIGSPGNGSVIKISAHVNGGSHDFLSNQFLGGLPAGFGNLGNNGSGGLDHVDLSTIDGDQFFAVTVPEPTSLVLLALAGMAIARRR